MQQNKYDDPSFFENYSRMPRSQEGLGAAGEWPVLRAMLPDLRGKRVLDLGCGYGWHCRYAADQGALQVTGVDLSAKMLEKARSYRFSPLITYLESPVESVDFPPGSFDVVISSLALHYVADYALLCKKVFGFLTAGGCFVFSTEHPVFTARAEQDWFVDKEGNRLHWPVDHYQQEGRRDTRFLGHEVIKYHRTMATLLNSLLQAGFSILEIAEPGPDPGLYGRYPEMVDETRRPIFVLVAARKPE
ncbi:class I SAM-dependent methyltransferase [Niabella beijingensis]|uniref:class I SAM-dependent methyltransferase n=1 Tax=Niabella beijingensis TaxID=2872700 RepID=UPI001CBC17CA|nr:class I SAM-dependent methyltransferase [Niabella beijingensis]MBZ4188230.1 class I SAM-dependent methyltransferase [Niabella beijingensis]